MPTRIERRLACGAALAVLLGTSAVLAQTPPPGETIEDRRQAFLLADTNGDGCLQLPELAHAMAVRFAALDRNRDGFLTKDELAEHDPAQFAKVDRNGDGKLSFLEIMEVKEVDFAKADKTKRGCLVVDEVIEFDGLK